MTLGLHSLNLGVMQSLGGVLARMAFRPSMSKTTLLLKKSLVAQRFCSTNVIFDVETVEDFTEKVCLQCYPQKEIV